MNYDGLFSLESMFRAWEKFRSGKTRKYEIMYFERHLEDNIFNLHDELYSRRYKHSSYEHFIVFDRKKRDIHKAKIKDRLVHQIIHDYLSEIFEPLFIADSYSSREEKGSHKAVKTFRYFMKLVGNGADRCFVLKCDIKKYFNSIDQEILLRILREKINDDEIFEIVKIIVSSFELEKGKALPLGNATSQIFANIYLNELDWFVKRELKARFYVRYNDDFVILDESSERLTRFLSEIRKFVSGRLKLEIPPNKCSLRKSLWGVDFLGFTVSNKFTLLRKSTKGKMKAKLNRKNIISYLGMLSHCNSFDLRAKILASF